MALSLTLAVLFLWGAGTSNAVTNADFTTKAPLTSTEATISNTVTEVQGTEAPDHASMIIHSSLL